MSDISREELAAFTDASTKSAVALEKVSVSLENIAKKQDVIIEKLANGIVDHIVDGVNSHYDVVHKETIGSLSRVEAQQADIQDSIVVRMPQSIEEKLTNSSIAQDILHTKWFIAITGTVIVVAMVLLRVVGFGVDNKQITDQTKTLEHMLEVHIKEAKDGANKDGK